MSNPALSLEGQVAVVTGASRGIGKETALMLARAGADVVVCDPVAGGELVEVESEIKKLGRHAVALRCDATDTRHVVDAVQKASKKFGRADILVISMPGAPDTEPDIRYERQKQAEKADPVLVVPGVVSYYYWSGNWLI